MISMTPPTVWGIHAGRTGDAHSLFLSKNVVAIGWHEIGDLSAIQPSREAFKAEVMRIYRNIKPGAIPNYAGQLYRFVHEMKIGDFVMSPSADFVTLRSIRFSLQGHLAFEKNVRSGPKRGVGSFGWRGLRGHRAAPPNGPISSLRICSIRRLIASSRPDSSLNTS